MRETKQPRFSIHDAFEEENDEAIRVYGSTVVSNISRPTNSGSASNTIGGSSSVGSSVGSMTNELTVTCDPRSVAEEIVFFVLLYLKEKNFNFFNFTIFFYILTEIINLERMIQHQETVIHSYRNI